MRITVNLSIFFHDHRSLAKIFIKKEMKCVKDVENHISELFNIENFYLKCENVYLPPTEDVQIFQHDDIVWAVPIEENVEPKKKKSKKQKTLPDYTPEAEESVKSSSPESLSSGKCEDTTPEGKNGNVASLVHNFEKQLHDSTKSPIEKRTNIVKTIIISNKNSPGKPDLPTTNNKFNVSKEEKLETISNCNGTENGTLEMPKPSTSNNTHSILQNEKNLEVFSDQNSKSTKEDKFRDDDSTIEKKTNIVKTIIISNKSTPVKPYSPTTKFSVSEAEKLQITDNCSGTQNGTHDDHQSTTSNNEHSILQKEENLKITNDQINKSGKEDEIRDYDSSSTWDTTSICNSTTSEINVTKRKRKRTRRRKYPENKESNATFQPPVDNFFQKPSVVPAAKHIRFSDGQSSPEIKDFDGTQGVVNELKDCPKTEEVGASGVMVSDSEQNKETPDDVTTDVEMSVTDKETKNNTLNAGPIVGDIIDFRILRISENYTPEVSSAIVGKVLSYDQVNKEVTFEVVYGLDQCVEPQGKFSLDQEEQPVNNQFQCFWDSLLRPRLICR